MNETSPKLCTYDNTLNPKYQIQPWRRCFTCAPNRVNIGVCLNCSTTCHAGHNLGPLNMSKFFCDCGGKQIDVKINGECGVFECKIPREKLQNV